MSEINIPGYEVIELIREGSAATLWKAKQPALNRSVVIKILHSDGTEEDESDIATIMVNVRRVAGIRHQGITRVLDVGESEGTRYIVTELTRGTTLQDMMAPNKPIPEQQILLLAQRVSKALGHAWTEEHLYHANLKPRSISIEPDRAVLVSELGMAIRGWILDESTGEHREIVIGTPNYMSPEQVSGRGELDARSDIYSLGAVLYHAVTGQMPFHDTPGQPAMQRHVSDQIPDPRKINPKVSAEFARILTTMMAKDADERYQSWDDVVDDLKRVGAKSGRKIVLQKNKPQPLSTIDVQAEPASSKSTSSAPSATIESSFVIIIWRLTKWAAVVILWSVLASNLMKPPL